MPLHKYELDILKDIIAIPSVGGESSNTYPYGEMPYKALETFLSYAESLGFKTSVIDNKVGYVEYGSGDKLLGIVCHLDVVPAGEGWTTEPFVLTIKNDSYYGRGIIDDKGPACATLFALKRLKDSGFVPNFRIRLILGTDEERTCSCVEHYAATSDIPDFAITPDAEFPAIFAEKGILHVKIYDETTISNALFIEGGNAANMVAPSASIKLTDGRTFIVRGKMAHASKPELGINAIDLIPNLLESNDITYSNTPLINFIKNFNAAEFTGCNITDDSGSLTTNSGIIKITNDEQFLIIDIRYPVTANYDSIIKNIDDYTKKYNLAFEVTSHMEPIYKDINSLEIKTLTQIWNKHMSDFSDYKDEYMNTYNEPLAMGGGTYARHIPNTVAFGIQTPWSIDQCHQADEHYSIKDFDALIDTLIDTIKSFESIK